VETFILNVIHRPEMVPEYLEKEAAQGRVEDIARSGVIRESLDIFRTQQHIAHEHGFRTTIQMTYASLFNDEAVSLAKEHSERYGDEISLTLLGLPCQQFREKYRTKDFCIWMFPAEQQRQIVDDVFGKFYSAFGVYPTSTGCYYLSAELIAYIKARYPTVTCAIATCWEEGPKAYRTTNNSWYLFCDGGPWSPWIPSKCNTHAIASGPDDDCGLVAIPHLSRDLLACFDGNGSNFGTHPQNVLRGMIYKDGQFPYLFNLIDQYRAQARYNNGFSYNMMFVGPGWMSKGGRWEVPYELSLKSYQDCMAYYAALRDGGELQDMTMTEFAAWYRAHKSYSEPACALWKDILYGSQKQLFWYCDPYMRTCIDMNQGGALIDLRPYAAKLVRPVGIGTPRVHDASYPYLIQAFYRAGYFTHYAGEGSIKSCKISYEGEEVDLCLCRTKATYAQTEHARVLTLDPVEIRFRDLSIRVVSTFTFPEDSGGIDISRKIVDMSNPGATVLVDEYVTACYGTTEYPENMDGITLRCTGADETKFISYQYACREAAVTDASCVEALVPQIDTRLSIAPIAGRAAGYVREGYAFSPMFTLGLTKRLSNGEEMATCLKLQKAD